MKNLFFFLFIFSSCISNNRIQQQEENLPIPEPPYTISLEKEIDNIQSVNLTEIGDTIIYIPLETSDKSLLKDLSKIIVTNDHIAVYDRSNILMFDHSGQFIRQISKRGQGPGEYSLLIRDYCFSLDNQKIYLLVDGNRYFEYNVDGKFLHSYKINTPAQEMLPLNDSLFVFYSVHSPKLANPSIIIADLNNNIQRTYPNYYKNNDQNVIISLAPFYARHGQIRFKEFGVDTLYTITENEIIPYSFVSLGKKLWSGNLSGNPMSAKSNEEYQKIVREQIAGKYFVARMLEDDVNLYISLYDLYTYLYGYYNKRSNSVKIIGDQGFQNNIDGGLPFFPKYVYNDSILVDYVNAFTLREHVLNGNATEMRQLYGQKYDDLVKLVNSLDDESNPVVVMVKK